MKACNFIKIRLRYWSFLVQFAKILRTPILKSIWERLLLKSILWKTETFFPKLEYSYLVESAKIENATFPYKSALSKAKCYAKKNGE